MTTKHEISVNESTEWSRYSRQDVTRVRAHCLCGWQAPYDRIAHRDAIGDGMVHMDEMSKIDPEMTIYDVLLELIEMQKWSSEGIKLRRVKAVQIARDNRLFGTEGNYKL